MTCISIFSGFLGAGKTTLIKKLVREAYNEEKIVIIENEFGDIGIDGGFLKESGIQVTEMNSGCICCSLVGDFTKALTEVIEKYNPDRIIIEPSGVGKLSDVLGAVEGVLKEGQIEVKGLVAVADAKKVKMYIKNFGEFYKDQISTASTIVLSRTGVVTDEQLKTAIDLIKEINEDANIITTPWDDIDGKTVLKAIEKNDDFMDGHHHEECDCHGHHHEECDCHEHHHHHEGECDCHEHHHHHEGECDCHEHHHHHEGECDCHEHHHHHEGECDCHEHHHHHADDVFTSWGIETPKKYDVEEIEQLLNRFSESKEFGFVLRAKGIVPAKDGKWIHFNYVPEESEVVYGQADYTGRICVIGTNLNEKLLDEVLK